jgi:hypothetical protein
MPNGWRLHPLVGSGQMLRSSDMVSRTLKRKGTVAATEDGDCAFWSVKAKRYARV